MASYLLLRDNKQKGPYSVADLISLGLKPYDLVWIEGKSAAWRYPSEIEELKTYAPVVEEQPFDRFFKRNDTQENNNTFQTQKKQEENASISVTPFGKVTSKENKIYVSLPGSIARKTQPEEKISRQVNNIKPPREEVHEEISKEESQEPEKVVRLEKRFSQPLDDIKDLYVQTLVDRKKKITRRRTWVGTLKKGSVSIYVLALGVLIGFVLNNINFKKATIVSEALPQSIQKQKPVQTKSQSTPKEQRAEDQLDLNSSEASNANNAAEKNEFTPKKKNTSLNTRTPVERNSQTSTNTGPNPDTRSEGIIGDQGPEGDTKPVNGERQKMIRSTTNKNLPGNTSNSEENIRKLVSVKSNDYKRGSFGGIYNLQITVNNNSRYILDEVIVQLQYLKPSEQTLKTESIRFSSISPFGTSTMNIPPSNRGIKVVYHITNIKYKETKNDTPDM